MLSINKINYKEKMKKNNKILISLLATIILSISFSSANLGCFLYQESEFYCNDLTLQEAEEECLLYLNCDVEEIYISANSCGLVEKFPQCALGTCKDSCEIDFVGKCQQGTISEDEVEEWCSSGCCVFSNSGTPFCHHKENKWLCAINAENNEVAGFNYDTSMNFAQCQNYCSLDKEILLEKIGLLKKDNTKEILTFKNYVVDLGSELDSKEKLEEKPNPSVSDSKSSLVYVVLLIVIITSLLIYLIYQRFKPAPKNLPGLNDIQKERRSEIEKLKEAITIKDLKKLAKIEEEKLQKIKNKRRESSLLELGLLPLKKEKKEFSKLRKIFQNYLKIDKIDGKQITKKEKKEIEKLSEMIKLSGQKKRVNQVPKNKEKMKLSKAEIDRIISGLRKISRK
jgi:hypothetical protein